MRLGGYLCKNLSVKKISKILAESKSSNCFPAVLHGWIKSVRHHKKTVFVDVDDGSYDQPFQVLIPKEIFPRNLNYGASLKVAGDVVQTTKHKEGVEMICSEVKEIGFCDPEKFPNFNDKTKTLGHFRKWPHLRVRETPMKQLLSIRSRLGFEIHRYFQERDYIHIHTPILTSNDCEGGCNVFNVQSFNESFQENVAKKRNFFNNNVHLTVSSQLHLQACALSKADVYTLSPVFRAEPSETRNHLAEFYMLEVERAFCQTQDEIMDVMQDSLQKVVKNLLEKCFIEFSILQKNIDKEQEIAINNMLSKTYPRITYDEAIEILNKNLGSSIRWGDDISSEQENFLTCYHENLPVFITNFPLDMKPFYVFSNDDNRTAAAVDLIVPFCGELSGGSVREHRIKKLKNRINLLMNQGSQESKDLDWYVEMIELGSVPHAGFGMGFDRLIRFLSGISNIKDVVPFPRYYHNCLL